MVYLDCGNASVGTPGAECLRSCHTLDVDCVSWGGAQPHDRPKGVPTHSQGSWDGLRPRPSWPRATAGDRAADGCPSVHSSALTACLAASAPRGWCQTGAGAAWPRRTAPVCTTRPSTGPGTPSGSTVTPGASRVPGGGAVGGRETTGQRPELVLTSSAQWEAEEELRPGAADLLECPVGSHPSSGRHPGARASQG